MPSFRAASSAASSGASTVSCSKPSGTVSGDILVAFHAADDGFLSDMTPSGGIAWNLLASRAREFGFGAGTKVWWRIAGGSEPSSYVFNHGLDADATVSIIGVQDASLNTPVVAQSGGTGMTTSVSTPSTTPTGSDDFEIRCAVVHVPETADTIFWTPPAGFTERTDVNSRRRATVGTATRTLAGGGATGTHVFTASVNVNEFQGFTVNIAGRSGFTGWGMPL